MLPPSPLAMRKTHITSLQRITLSRTKEGYVAFEHDSNLSFHFTRSRRTRGYSIRRLSSVTDLDGRSIRLSYENGVLATLTKSCGHLGSQSDIRMQDSFRPPPEDADGSSSSLFAIPMTDRATYGRHLDALGQTTRNPLRDPA